MKTSQQVISVFLILATFVSGCAQYKRPPMMIKVPDFYEHKVRMSQLTLVADSYLDSAKSKHFFNSDLPAKGFFPIFFVAFNFGDTAYDLSKTNFYLLSDDGVKILPMDPVKVSKKVLKHTSLRMLGWGFAGLIILSIPFSLTAGVDSFRANQDIRHAVKDNTLRVFEVDPREAVGGFYFFEMGKGSRAINEARSHQYSLMIENLKEKDSDKLYEFRIGVS